MIRRTASPAIVVVLLSAAAAAAAELPRLNPLDAVAARESLRGPPGFRIDLGTAEGLLSSPVAIAWDKDGRLFVAEMRGYSEHRDERLGRIRLLTDIDDDGVYDRAEIFAAGLAWPGRPHCAASTAACSWAMPPTSST